MECKHIVREFIIETLLFGECDLLTDDTSFYNTGLIDSTGILEIIAFLEEKFQIQIEDDELIPENLGNLASIDRFLDKKLQGE